MDKIITIVVAATVFMLGAVSLMLMVSGGVGQGTNDVQQSGSAAKCDLQVDRYCNGGVELSQLSQECISVADQRCGVSSQEMDQQVAERAGVPVLDGE